MIRSRIKKDCSKGKWDPFDVHDHDNHSAPEVSVYLRLESRPHPRVLMRMEGSIKQPNVPMPSGCNATGIHDLKNKTFSSL